MLEIVVWISDHKRSFVHMSFVLCV